MSPERAQDAGADPTRPAAGEALRSRLRGTGPALVLDGATGTELERAGLPTGLPLWSTHALLEAPDAVRQIHRNYLEAGAEIITANTFRTQQRTLTRAGLPDADDGLTRRAIELAYEATRMAHHDRDHWIAGSLPPLEDCYRPDRAPTSAECEREHARQAELLARHGAQLILVETHNSQAEALSAARAAARTGLPFVVTFVSWENGLLLSGESLARAAQSAFEAGADCVGVNCVPPSMLEPSLGALTPLGVPLSLAPNLGEPNDDTGFSRSESTSPDRFGRRMARLIAAAGSGLSLIGGCCGTTPDHIAALARARDSLAGVSPPSRPR